MLGGSGMSFVEKLILSIPENLYIFIAAFFAVICLVIVSISNKNIDKSFEQWKSENYYSNLIYKTLTIMYSLFVTLITIFPLLGMFGTVKSLLQLNLTDENAIISARSSFFDALTSTAWGIIFAIIFKLVNAIISKHAEDNIDKISELKNNRAEKR